MDYENDSNNDVFFSFLSGEQTFGTKLNWRKNICSLLIDGSINTQNPP